MKMIFKKLKLFLICLIILISKVYSQNYFYITNLAGKTEFPINSEIKNPFEIQIRSNGVINTNITARIYIYAKKIDSSGNIIGDATTLKIDPKYNWEEEGSKRYYGHTVLIKGRCPIDTILDSVPEDVLIIVSDARENVEKLPATNFKLKFKEYKGKIIINEVNYDTGYIWQKEWVEFYNTTSETLNMGNFILKVGTTNYNKFPANSKIPPYGYLLFVANLNYFTNCFYWVKPGTGEYKNSVIVENSVNTKPFRIASRPPYQGLYNHTYSSGDIITLLDSNSNVIEVLNYKHSWKPKVFDISLERKDPLGDANSGDNWGGSVDPRGCTPGKRNSIASPTPSIDYTKIDVIEVSKRVFNPKKEQIKIAYKLSSGAKIKINVYNSEGVLIDELLNETPQNTQGEIIFYGKDRAGNPLPPGIYIIYAEIIESNTNKIIKASKSVVVNYW